MQANIRKGHPEGNADSKVYVIWANWNARKSGTKLYTGYQNIYVCTTCADSSNFWNNLALKITIKEIFCSKFINKEYANHSY